MMHVYSSTACGQGADPPESQHTPPDKQMLFTWVEMSASCLCEK